MFQEASATARELKVNVHNSKYVLVCEWLDMTPIDTSKTSIDNVIILRKQKRMNSNVRGNFSTVEGRKSYYNEYKKFILSNPLDFKMFEYLVNLLNDCFPMDNCSDSKDMIRRGYF